MNLYNEVDKFWIRKSTADWGKGKI
jgi:hypothetical protein